MLQRYVDEQRRMEEEDAERASAIASKRSRSPTSVPAPAPTTTTTTTTNTTAFMNPMASSMSRRNLETIVEAIRHLEGDSVLLDNVKVEPVSMDRNELSMSDDSEPGDCSMSDIDECKSERSCGRVSPGAMSTEELIELPSPTTTTATIHVDSHILNSQKYPIATQLLHRPSLPQPLMPQRPGVIVHNLS